jgi:hypothetical protein
MSEETNQDIDQKADSLSKLAEQLEKIMKSQVAMASAMSPLAAGQMKYMMEKARTEKEHLEAAKKNAETIETAIEDTENAYKAGTLTADALTAKLKDLETQIGYISDENTKTLLRQQKAELEQISALQTLRQSLTITSEHIKTFSTALASKMTQLMTGAMTTGDAIGATGHALGMGVDVMNTAAQGASKTISSVGAAMSMVPGPIGLIGKAATFAGAALGVLANVTSELVKAGIQVLVSGTKDFITAFNKATSAGVLMSNGLTEMRRDTLAAGITMSQFGDIVSQNAETISESGMGMAAGTQLLLKSMKVGGRQARDEMFNLGYTLEEQGALYARTMQIMNNSTLGLYATDQQVAEQTKEYAKSLREVSDVTGKNAAAQEAQVKEAQNNLAAQQALAKMTPKQREAYNALLRTMSPEDIKALNDRIAHYGAISDSTTGALESLSPALRKVHMEQQALYNQIKAGNISQKQATAEGLKIQTDHAAAINREYSKQSQLAAMGDTEMTRRITDEMKHNSHINEVRKKILASEKANQEASAKGADSVGQLQEAQQTMSVSLNKLVGAYLPKFGSAIQEVTKVISDSINSLSGENGVSKVLWEVVKGVGLTTAVAAALAWMTNVGVGKIVSATMSKIPGAGSVLSKIGGGIAESKESGMLGRAAQGAKSVLEKSKIGGLLDSIKGKDLGAGEKMAGMFEHLKGAVKGISEGTGPFIESVFKGVATGVGYFGNPEVLRGALGLAAIGGSIAVLGWSMEKASAGMKTFAGVPWKDALIGIGVLTAITIGAGMGIEIVAPAAVGLMALGTALTILGGGMKQASVGFKSFAGIEWSSALKGLLAVTGITVGAAALAPIALVASVAMIGISAGMLAFGGASIVLGKGLKSLMEAGVTGPSLKKLATGLSDFISDLPYIRMIAAAPGVSAMGLALLTFKLGASGLIAMSKSLDQFNKAMTDAVKSGLLSSLPLLGSEAAVFMDKLPYLRMLLAATGINVFGKSLITLSTGLKALESVDTKKINRVAESTSELNGAISGGSIISTAVGTLGAMVGGLASFFEKPKAEEKSKLAPVNTGAHASTTGTSKEDPMDILLRIQSQNLENSTKMLKVMKDQNDTIDKLLKVSS